MILIYLLFVSIIAGTSTMPIAENDTTTNGLVMTICSLIYEEPYYKCDEKWIILYAYESDVVYDLDKKSYAGFAYHKISPLGTNSICKYVDGIEGMADGVCKWKWMVFGNQYDDGCWGGICMTMLQHELEHLKCGCNFHRGMVQTYGITV